MRGKILLPLECGKCSKWFSIQTVEAGNIDRTCNKHVKRFGRWRLRKDKK